MKLAIFGGTGFVGTELLRQALAGGHEVTALARDPAKLPAHERLRAVKGEVGDAARVSAAVEGAQAVVSVLGLSPKTPRARPSEGLAHLLSAMQAHGVRRLVALSGAAIPYPGDNPNPLQRFVSFLIRVGEGEAAKDKFRERDLILQSALDWTMVRPPKILDGDRSAPVRVALGHPAGTTITRGQVARFLLEHLGSTQYVQKAPCIAG
jgi:putative NADH-flavin reductase